MKLHDFQDQSFQVSVSPWLFLKSCLLLACMMGQRAAERCFLLSLSSLGCHQSPAVGCWQHCVHVTPCRTHCSLRDETRTSDTSRKWPLCMRHLRQTATSWPQHEEPWGKSCLGQMATMCGESHQTSASGQWPPHIRLCKQMAASGKQLPHEGPHWQMAASAKWWLCALLSLPIGLVVYRDAGDTESS